MLWYKQPIVIYQTQECLLLAFIVYELLTEKVIITASAKHNIKLRMLMSV